MVGWSTEIHNVSCLTVLLSSTMSTLHLQSYQYKIYHSNQADKDGVGGSLRMMEMDKYLNPNVHCWLQAAGSIFYLMFNDSKY